MNILHVVQGYSPSIGGTQWLVQNLSEQLVSRHQDQVTVFTTVAYNMEDFLRPGRATLPAGVEEMNGVTVRRFPVWNRLSLLRTAAASASYRLRLPGNDWLRTIQQGPLIRSMTRAVAESGTDVVLAGAFPLMHVYYALAGARRGHIPLVLLGAIHVQDRWGYERPMIYRAIEQADGYIALTPFERDYLIARGIAADKVSVIGPGVDAEPFLRADGAAARTRYGWSDDPLVALVAKQTPRKRIDLLLEAMRQVWPVQPSVRLLLAGARTPYSAQLEQMVERLPPEQRDRVTLFCDFPESLKPELLAACDLFVLPSTEESFGIAFLEAWACGKAVIGARVGAISTVIDEGRDGLLARPGDAGELAEAILALLSDPARRQVMGAVGQRRVAAEHSWPVVAGQVREVYQQVIDRHKGEPSR